MQQHNELFQLQEFISANNVSAKTIYTPILAESLVPLEFNIGQQKIVIQVIDEYNDLAFQNTMMPIILALRELEILMDSKDYLDWCRQQNLRPNTDLLRTYYREVTHFVSQVHTYFKDAKLTSFISDLDFQLNSGAIQMLRK